MLAGEALVGSLRSAAWKERLEAMEALQARVQELKENLDASTLIQVLHARRPPGNCPPLPPMPPEGGV